jgi:dTDP-4-amino-4,6-dideoxygalactose transaminase
MSRDAPVRTEPLVFGQPEFGPEAIDEIVDTVRSGWVGTGPKAARFEQELASYVGSTHALAVSSCSAALHLALLAIGVGPGDEVITTPLTFVATVNAILHVGAVPVLVDVDRATQNLDPARVAEAVTARTRALLPVHMAGRPCDLDALAGIAREHGIAIIEDAAHALGAEYRGTKIGAVSDLTTFSFYATKNVSMGEGGVITTERDDWAELIRSTSHHGLAVTPWQRTSTAPATRAPATSLGFKYNLTDLHASLGLHQLARIDEWQVVREKVWHEYDRGLEGLPLVLPAPPAPDTVHARHLYTVLFDIEALGHDRDWIRGALQAEGIGTGVHYNPVHLQPYHAARLGYAPTDFPNAVWIGERTVSLPLSPFLDEQDVDDVITAVHEVVGSAR